MNKNYKFLSIGLASFVFCGVLTSACMPNTNYPDYVDQKKKGEKAFLKDLQVCRQFTNENLKPPEGSEGARERLKRKRALFLLCMENHYWILKQ